MFSGTPPKFSGTFGVRLLWAFWVARGTGQLRLKKEEGVGRDALEGAGLKEGNCSVMPGGGGHLLSVTVTGVYFMPAGPEGLRKGRCVFLFQQAQQAQLHALCQCKTPTSSCEHRLQKFHRPTYSGDVHQKITLGVSAFCTFQVVLGRMKMTTYRTLCSGHDLQLSIFTKGDTTSNTASVAAGSVDYLTAPENWARAGGGVIGIFIASNIALMG